MGTTEIRVDGQPLTRKGASGGAMPLDRRVARWVAWVPPSLRAALPPAVLVSLVGAWSGLQASEASVPGPFALPLASLSGLSAGVLGLPGVGAGLFLLAFAAVLDLVHRIVRQDVLPAVADRAVWLAGIGPAGWLLVLNPWLMLPLLLSLGALLASRRGHVAAAAVLVTGAALWVPGALLLLLAVGWCLVRQRGFSPARWGLGGAMLLLPPGVVLLVTWLAAPEPMGVPGLTAAAVLGSASPVWPWSTAMAWGGAALSGGLSEPVAVPVLLLLVLAVLTVLAVRRLHPGLVLAGVGLGLAALSVASPGLVPWMLLPVLPLVGGLAHVLDGHPGLERLDLAGLTLTWSFPLLALSGVS